MFERDKLGEIVDGHTLRFVRVVHHSCERVWRAITDETELAHWMGYRVRFEPRVDGRVYFFGEDERIEGKVFIFDPPRLTVKTGATVAWTNGDDIPHTVAASTKLFKSKVLDTDEKFSFTFATPGVYEYFCSLHPHMTGTIVVEAATGSVAPPQ